MQQKPHETFLNILAIIIFGIPLFVFYTIKLIFTWLSYSSLFWWMAKHPNYTDSVKNTSGYWIMVVGTIILVLLAGAASSWYHLHCV